MASKRSSRPQAAAIDPVIEQALAHGLGCWALAVKGRAQPWTILL